MKIFLKQAKYLKRIIIISPTNLKNKKINSIPISLNYIELNPIKKNIKYLDKESYPEILFLNSNYNSINLPDTLHLEENFHSQVLLIKEGLLIGKPLFFKLPLN
jgi:hypothetical protein